MCVCSSLCQCFVIFTVEACTSLVCSVSVFVSSLFLAFLFYWPVSSSSRPHHLDHCSFTVSVPLLSLVFVPPHTTLSVFTELLCDSDLDNFESIDQIEKNWYLDNIESGNMRGSPFVQVFLFFLFFPFLFLVALGIEPRGNLESHSNSFYCILRWSQNFQGWPETFDPSASAS